MGKKSTKKILTGIVAAVTVCVSLYYGYIFLGSFIFDMLTEKLLSNTEKQVIMENDNNLHSDNDSEKNLEKSNSAEGEHIGDTAEVPKSSGKPLSAPSPKPNAVLPDVKIDYSKTNRYVVADAYVVDDIRLREVSGEVTAAEKSRVISILTSCISPSNYPKIVEILKGGITAEERSEIYSMLRKSLTVDQKNEIARIFIKYSDVEQKR